MCLQRLIRRTKSKNPPDVLVEEFLESLQGQAVLQCHVHSQDRDKTPQRLEFIVAIPADVRSRLMKSFAHTNSGKKKLKMARSTATTSTSTAATEKSDNPLEHCSLTWPNTTAVKVDKKAMGIEEFVNAFVKSGRFLGLTTFPGTYDTVTSWHLLHTADMQVKVDRVFASPQDTCMADLWHGAMDLQVTWQGRRTVVVGNPVGLMKITGAS